MSNILQQGIRTAGSSSLQTVSIVDLINHINAVDFRLVTDGDGIERLHVVAPDESYYTIKVGDSATISGEDGDRIKSVINSNVIYCGVTENGAWFTFGKKPSNNAKSFKVSVASLMASVNGKLAMIG